MAMNELRMRTTKLIITKLFPYPVYRRRVNLVPSLVVPLAPGLTRVSLASEKYSSLDAGRFSRYEWAYIVQNSLYFDANVSVVL
jgi:hypothetical protein